MPTLLHCKCTTHFHLDYSKLPLAGLSTIYFPHWGKWGHLKTQMKPCHSSVHNYLWLPIWTFTKFQALPMTLGMGTLNSAPTALPLAHVLQLILSVLSIHIRQAQLGLRALLLLLFLPRTPSLQTVARLTTFAGAHFRCHLLRRTFPKIPK